MLRRIGILLSELLAITFTESEGERQCACHLEGNPWQRLSNSKNEAISEDPVGLKIIFGNRTSSFPSYSSLCSF